MDDGRLSEIQARRDQIEFELRWRLALPDWSNLRGDDVIGATEALDADSRVRVNALFVERQEIEDERARR